MKELSGYLQAESSLNNFVIGKNPNLCIKDSQGYEVRIIADSKNSYNSRLTTIVATYPRFVHSELMTHRAFSRNAASSRAIPVSKTINALILNSAAPYKWQKNKSGMSGGDYLSKQEEIKTKHEWMNAKTNAILSVQNMMKFGDPHKQICNRLLEPFMWMTTVISATNWNNFFALRCNDLADPTIRHIAEMIKYVYENNKPIFLNEENNNLWHLPFVRNSLDEKELNTNFNISDLIKISVARCARVSYLNHDKKFDPEGDLKLCENLERDGHWSPFEHVARVINYFDLNFVNGNFHYSWMQYRKTFSKEYIQ